MSEAIETARNMKKVIKRLAEEKENLEQLGQAKADAMCEYDKLRGVRELVHKDAGMSVTLVPGQAKKDCAELLRDKVVAEERLKAKYCVIDILKSQLNAYQSINRHLSVS